jgi:thiol-disulfide isomerase/thioredoxin
MLNKFATMKMLIILSFLLLLLANSGKAQIRVYDFESFRHMLNKENDTTYVINFWATWCAPCVKELPDFEKINDQFRNRKFKMLLVSLDFRKSLETRLIPFVKERGLKAEVLMLHEPDANAWIDRVDQKWTGSIPATLIYNRDYRYFREGSFTYDELNQLIIHNLKQ